MSNPLVSVVIPTYNHANFLKEAIQSVLEQSYGNIELIVVDNYSQDNTEEVVQGFSDERVHYFKFSNKGVIAASRNYGIKQARGIYIAFLDSDDRWKQDKLKYQIKALEQRKERGISFCRSMVLSRDCTEHCKILGPKANHLPERIYERLMKVNFILSSTVVVRKEVLDDVGLFDESKEFVCSEDFDLWLRIVRKYEHGYVPYVGAFYRIHETNESANDNRLEKALAVIEKHRKQGWISNGLGQHAKASFYFQSGWTLIQQNRILARKQFREAIRLGARHGRIIGVSILGLILSYTPWIYNMIKRQKLDQKMGKHLLNSQNI